MALLSLYNNSISLLVETEYPEFAWKPWKFSVLHFWNELGRLYRAGDPLALAVVEGYISDLARERETDVYSWQRELPKLTSAESYRISFLDRSLSRVLNRIYGPTLHFPSGMLLWPL